MLKQVAIDNDLGKQWDRIVSPWLDFCSLKIVKANYTSVSFVEVPSEEAASGVQSPEVVPQGDNPDAKSSGESPQEDPSSSEPPKQKTLKDMTMGSLSDQPWQHKKYSSLSAIWQGAAMRRRRHMRRSNKSLGVCAVDLSGPHEKTPRPGYNIGKNHCFYFLALTVRPDKTAESCDIAIQATEQVQTADRVQIEQEDSDDALIYAELLGSKDEAPAAIKKLLAQINNDHANFPHTIIFRIHSDRGGEFVNADLEKYCMDHGIHKTTTQGYDPNGNTAENTVGILKRRSRYLLSGHYSPTPYWGVAVLAAAHLCEQMLGWKNTLRSLLGRE